MKLIEELLPSDRVVVRFGAKTMRDEESGENITIDPEKDMAVNYAYYQEVIKNTDEWNAEKSYYKSIQRKVELIGMAGTVDSTGSLNDNFIDFVVVPFDTLENRALREQEARQLQQIAQQEAEAEQQAEKIRYEARLEAEQKEAEQKAANDAKEAQLKTLKAAITDATKALGKAVEAANKKPESAELKKASEEAAIKLQDAKEALINAI